MVSKESYKIFFGRNHDYYLNRLNLLEKTNKISFNPDAFFLGVLWVLYRKMYYYGLITIVISLLLSFLNYSFFKYNYFSIVIALIIGIIYGLFGNYLYINYCTKRIVQLNINSKELSKKGSTNIYIPLLILIAILVFSYLLG